MASLTIRIDPDVQRALDRLATARGVTRSEVVRESLRLYLAGQDRNLAWELGKGVFGRHGSGRHDLSTAGEEVLRERFRAAPDGD